ncbi:MAG TPA: porin [Croceibacterium sp.]|nr:porin [Croceibacterium sp.]
MTVTAGADTSVTWKGAPEVEAAGGWSFKPRGRIQIDSGVVDAPASIASDGFGFTTELRRAYLGVDGTIPGNFGYRIEADFADGVDLTDVYLTYDASEHLTLTLGHQKPFWGLEEMTSDLFTTMLERAAFNSAFGFERRVGISGTYAKEAVQVQFGIFTDDIDSLDDSNNSYSIDGRVVFNPKLGDGQLHIGGSAHLRDLNDAASTVRYRARPFSHTTDVRLIDTGEFSASGERNFGLELAYLHGPFHAVVEGHQMTARRPGLPDPTFRGGYAEVGMLLTPGDRPGYRNGAFDRIRPVNPVTAGGIGAIQVNARYDTLDLSDEGIAGGRQQTLGFSAVWVPTDYLRFLVNYGHLWIDDAAVLAGTDSGYEVDAVAVRAQVDF